MEKSFRYNLSHLVSTEVLDHFKSGRVGWQDEIKFKTWWSRFWFDGNEQPAGVYYQSINCYNLICTNKEDLGMPHLPENGCSYYWVGEDVYYKPSILLQFTKGSFKRTFETIEEARDFGMWITTHPVEFVTLTWYGDEWKQIYDGQLTLEFNDS